MNAELQKASISKRIAAAMLDFILLIIIVTGAAFALSSVLGLSKYATIIDARQAHFEAEYNVKFDITAEDFEKLTEDEQKKYDEAYRAITDDSDFMQAYTMQINLILLITTFSILLGILVVELCIPLWLKNGQTVGKKVFSLGLIREDGVQLTTLQLFIRSILGKYTIETMIPVYIIITIFLNTANILSLAILVALLLGQIISLIVTKTNSAIHDLLARTVVIDVPSQRIFKSSEELLAYTKKIHAERANRSDYK